MFKIPIFSFMTVPTARHSGEKKFLPISHCASSLHITWKHIYANSGTPPPHTYRIRNSGVRVQQSVSHVTWNFDKVWMDYARRMEDHENRVWQSESDFWWGFIFLYPHPAVFRVCSCFFVQWLLLCPGPCCARDEWGLLRHVRQSAYWTTHLPGWRSDALGILIYEQPEEWIRKRTICRFIKFIKFSQCNNIFQEIRILSHENKSPRFFLKMACLSLEETTLGVLIFSNGK